MHAAGEADGSLYLVTRYVEGGDLPAFLAREGRLSPERALAILGQVADALDAAHRRGLVHRDVKPGNILLDEAGHTYLADFGLAKRLADESGATATGQLVGTLDYLAPEQIRGQELDGRADEYALACLLYECLAGEPPFRRETEAETLWAQMQAEPPSLSAYPALDPVLRKALAKAREERYESCGALIAAAREALGLGAVAHRAPLLPAWLRRRARLIALVGALLVAGAAAAAVVQLTRDSGPGGLASVAPNSVAAIDPETNAIVAQVPVGRNPADIAVGEGAVWVLNADDQTISRIDPGAEEERRFGTGTRPTALAAGAGALWVGNGTLDVSRFLATTSVSRIDPRTGIVEQTIELPVGRPPPGATGAGIAVAGGAVWVIGPDSRVSRIDPETGEVVATIGSVRAGTITAGDGAVWVLDGRVVSRISPRTNTVTARIEVPGVEPLALAAGAGGLGHRPSRSAPWPCRAAVPEGLRGHAARRPHADPYAAYTAQATEVLLDAIARSNGTRASVVEELFATEVEAGSWAASASTRTATSPRTQSRSSGSSARTLPPTQPGPPPRAR